MNTVLLVDDDRHHRCVRRAVPLLNADGSIREWVGTTTDVPGQKVAEEELARTQLMPEMLPTPVPVCICYLDRDLRYLVADNKLAERNGLPANLGKTFGEFVPVLLATTHDVTRRILAT